jgi:four helix bundle protein
MTEKRNKIENVEDMPVYRLFFDLAVEVERETRAFNPDFRWLRIQMLKSSESSFANLSEGFYSQYSTEYLQCLYRSRREARETVSHLNYAVGVDPLSKIVGTTLQDRYAEALRQLGNLINSIEQKIRERGKSKAGIPGVREGSSGYDIAVQSPPFNEDAQ